MAVYSLDKLIFFFLSYQVFSNDSNDEFQVTGKDTRKMWQGVDIGQ
jgi:hypothetical protein